jgi:hypothetical protein
MDVVLASSYGCSHNIAGSPPQLSELIVFTMVANTNDGIPSTLQEDLELFRRVMRVMNVLKTGI